MNHGNLRIDRNMARHPWASFLHLVKQPSRYTGGEFGSRVNADASYSVALVFPDVYEVGMSHLGTHILYSILADQPDIRVERAFSPWPDMEAEIRARGLELVSLETWQPLSSFDVLGFSLQHELCYTNVLAALDLAGIEIRSVNRRDSDPIVIAGGPCASHPEPVAPFVDAVFIGEAESAIVDMVRTVGSMKKAGEPRSRILEALAAMPGVYVPSMYVTETDTLTGWQIPVPANPSVPPAIRKVVVDLDRHPIPTRTIMPWNRAVFDRVSIEVARGCSEGCRFCEAGFSYRPLRDRDPARLFADSLEAIKICGYEEVSLGALSPADYPALPALVSALSTCVTPLNVTLSVSSLRAYGLSEDVLRDMKAVRTAGLTLAPEAGSQRLRDVINKNISDSDMMEAARRAFASGWQRLKLYFMVGLPTETEEDVYGIVDLARAVLKLGRGMGRADVNAAVGVFVPRPHTPFQWEGMADEETIRARQFIIRDASRRTGVTFKYPELRISRLECILARGDRKVADAVELAFRAGCRFDNWTESFEPQKWDAAFAAAGVDARSFLNPVPHQARLPWEIADLFVSRRFLEIERERAYSGRVTRPCEKPENGGLAAADFDSGIVCHGCGAGCETRDTAGVRRATAVSGDNLRGIVPAAASVDGFSTWHVRFTRCGASAFLAQTDLVKHIPRVFKRAGCEPVFSGGFHPMPKFSYCEPVPVGYQSLGEWAEVRITGNVAPDLDTLNRCSVDGMKFLSVEPAVSRRGGFIPSRFAFSYPIPESEAASLLGVFDGGPVDIELLPGIEALNPYPFKPGEQVRAVVWPARAGRPAERAHAWLSEIMKREYVPSDLVRLYDSPGIRAETGAGEP